MHSVRTAVIAVDSISRPSVDYLLNCCDLEAAGALFFFRWVHPVQIHVMSPPPNPRCRTTLQAFCAAVCCSDGNDEAYRTCTATTYVDINHRLKTTWGPRGPSVRQSRVCSRCSRLVFCSIPPWPGRTGLIRAVRRRSATTNESNLCSPASERRRR